MFAILIAGLRFSLCALLLVHQIVPYTFPSARSINTKSLAGIVSPAQPGTLNIKQVNPVVNEKNQITLSATDSGGQPVTGVTWESGSPDIAAVDQTGHVSGILRGFATITARKGSDSVSTFLVVTRVGSGKGAMVTGDTKTDTGGHIYLSDPTGNVIMRKDGFLAPANTFAGQKNVRGKVDGTRLQALFNAPTAVAVDNSANGGVYITDTANHSVRKVDFNDQVTTMLGTGSPGTMTGGITPFANAVFKGLRGIATDTGGNLFVADTENHAIFYADFVKREVRLLAGEPGTAGKQDGGGRAARFNRPAGIALSSDGRLLIVADTGNNVVRLVTRDGTVATLGKASLKSVVRSPKSEVHTQSRTQEPTDYGLRTTDLQQAGEIPFNEPQSVSIDDLGNIYVVDKSGAQVVTRSAGQSPQVFSLAQPNVSFGNAVSIVVRGTESFVLDSGAASQDEAVKVVTVGAPAITGVSPESGRLEGGAVVTITGQNFAPESLVALGDSIAADAVVESATRIHFTVPPQTAPGARTLSVQTRGGVVQRSFTIEPKPLSELKDGEITTIAGGIPYLGDGGLAVGASLNFNGSTSFPFLGGVTADGAGNVFIADSSNHRIRRMDISGVINTVVGNGREGFSGDGGPAIGASLNYPRRVVLDKAGNLFIADRDNNRIRRVDAATGIITTVAGNGNPDFSGDGGPAQSASFSQPWDVAVDSAGNLYIADASNQRIRRVDAATGIISTIAGNGKQGFGGDNGPAIEATLTYPISLALDGSGSLYFADAGNHRIRRIVLSTGIITTVAGDGAEGDFGTGRFSGDGGPATSASLSNPAGVAVDSAGNLYISDYFNQRVRRVDGQTNIITTVAGGGDNAFSGGDGGPATSAGMDLPSDAAVDGSGNLLIVDSNHDRIRRVDAATQIISTVAGIGNTRFSGDGGLALGAILSLPINLALDGAGNLYITDAGNNRIRRVDAATRVINTVAGTGNYDFNGDGGPAVDASLYNPNGVAVNPTGSTFFLSDRDNARIRQIDNGTISTLAGNGDSGFGGDGGPADKASFNTPFGLTLDSAGNLLIADEINHRIRRVDAKTKIITTVAGSGPSGYDNGDFGGDGGQATTARLNRPIGVAVDTAGNLFIADGLNFCIRRVDAKSGIITTVAGRGDGADGDLATKASIDLPTDIAVDAAGNLFIATSAGARIRRVDAATGIISTVAGNGSFGYSGDGGPATGANLNNPSGVTLDKQGNLLIADSYNNVIRVVKGVGKGISQDTQKPVVSNVTLSKTKVKRKKDATLGIRWTSTDNVGVVAHDLLFATDGVTFATTIVAGLPGSVQQFTWTIPSSVAKTKTGRVKVIAKDAAGNTGETVSGTVLVK